MGVVQGLKDELSETRRQLRIVRGVGGTCPRTGMPLADEQLQSRQRSCNFAGMPEEATAEHLGLGPRLLVPGLRRECPTCGNPAPAEGRVRQLQHDYPKRNEVEARNMSLGSHGSQLQFVQKLRAKLDQERSKNQELSRKLCSALSKQLPSR